MRSELEFSRAPLAVIRKTRVIALIVSMVGSLAQKGLSQESPVTYTTITAPGAGTKSGQGTFAITINDAAVLTGFYVNSGSYTNGTAVYHGFLRAANGTYTTFDAPGAGTKAGQGTQPASINAGGALGGIFYDVGNVEHCFIRQTSGAFITVNVAGAGTGSGQGTGCTSINKSGTVAGIFVDAANTSHGFFRTASGSVTVIDVPGAGTGSGNGTKPTAMNDSGTVTGFFVDDSGIEHGFVRSASGTIMTFDPQGSGGGSSGGTTVTSINAGGMIAGDYNSDGGPTHGFVRASNGTITTFSVGVADFVSSLNNGGTTAGFTATTAGFPAFFRTSSGTATKFVPTGCSVKLGVIAYHINNSADIVGYCQSTAGVYNGFLRTP